MPTDHCLYAILSEPDFSTIRTESEHHVDLQDAGLAWVRKIAQSLSRENVSLTRAQPVRISIENTAQNEHPDDTREGFWMSDDHVTVDHLVEVQARGAVRNWLSQLRNEERHLSHNSIAAMAAADTPLRALGRLASEVGKELLRTGISRADAPWNRDLARCEKVHLDITLWSEKGSVTDYFSRLHVQPRALYGTPMTIPVSPSNDIEADFVEWISNLIEHGLRHNRPVLIKQYEKVKNPVISEMISRARSSEALV